MIKSPIKDRVFLMFGYRLRGNSQARYSLLKLKQVTMSNGYTILCDLFNDLVFISFAKVKDRQHIQMFHSYLKRGLCFSRNNNVLRIWRKEKRWCSVPQHQSFNLNNGRYGTIWLLNHFRRYNSEYRVALEEIGWSELKPAAQCWHQRKIFLVWRMMEPQGIPQHYVLVLYSPVSALSNQLEMSRNQTIDKCPLF